MFSGENALQEDVPVIFDVVATNISPLVERNDLQFLRCPGTYHALLLTKWATLISRSSTRRNHVFGQSAGCGHLPDPRTNPSAISPIGDSCRLEIAQVHPHSNYKSSVTFLGRSMGFQHAGRESSAFRAFNNHPAHPRILNS